MMIMNKKLSNRLLLTFVLLLWWCLPSYSQHLREKQLLAAKSDSCMVEAQMAYNKRDAKSIKELCQKAIGFNPDNDAAYYMLARVALIESNFSEAEKLLKRVVEIDSTNYYYGATLAAVHLQNSNITSAATQYESLIRRFPQKSDSYVALINIYLPRAQFDKALAVADLMDKNLGLNDASVMTRFRIYSAQRNREKAIQTLLNAEAISPSPVYESYLGDLYLESRKDSLAMLYYDKALAQEPNYPPALYGKMEHFRMSGNRALYLGNLKAFLGNSEIPANAKVQHVKQVLRDPAYMQNYGKEMSECLYTMAKAHPADSSAAITAAIFMANSNNPQMAQEVLDQILKYYPRDSYIRNNMAFFLYSRGNWERLESFADSSMVLLEGEDIKAMRQLKGIAQYNLKKYDSAIETYLTAEADAKRAKDKVQLVEIYSAVGDMYHLKKDNASAFKYYDKALKIDGRYAPVLNNYAWYLATGYNDEGSAAGQSAKRKKELQKALSMSRITIEDHPGESTYLDTYAWICYLNGDLESARKNFQQAVAYGGNESVVTLKHYADVLYDLGEKDLAKIYYQRAFNLAKQNGEDEEIEKINNKAISRGIELNSK